MKNLHDILDVLYCDPDGIDHGEGTTHCINHIAVKRTLDKKFRKMLNKLTSSTDNDENDYVDDNDNKTRIYTILWTTAKDINLIWDYMKAHPKLLTLVGIMRAPADDRGFENAHASRRGLRWLMNHHPTIKKADVMILADVNSKMHKPKKNVRYANVHTRITDASVKNPIVLNEFIIRRVLGLELNDPKIWHTYGEICTGDM
jgi:hypothetical protein